MIVGLVATAGLLGIAATGGEAHAASKLKNLGFKVYWSLLTAEQKEEAKEIIADHLADTATDRLKFAARVLEYKADVADVLTKEQRIALGKYKAVAKRLPERKRKALLVKFLDRLDRALLAERLESLDGATPEDRVAIGVRILDQVHEGLKAALVERIELTDEQARKIDLLWSDVKKDLEPVALRLAKARAAVIEKGTGLLTDEQKTKLEKVKETVAGKVVAFIRG
jgi:hypothetical protein